MTTTIVDNTSAISRSVTTSSDDLQSAVVMTIDLERVTLRDIRAVRGETAATIDASRIHYMTPSCTLAPWVDVEWDLMAWVAITVGIFRWSGVCYHKGCGHHISRRLEARATRQNLIKTDMWWKKAA